MEWHSAEGTVMEVDHAKRIVGVDGELNGGAVLERQCQPPISEEVCILHA